METRHPNTHTNSDTQPDAQPDADLVDTRDMVVVHTALLRELRLAPGVVAGVPDHDRRRAAVVDGYLRLACELMHHHHTGEDELLWPVLAPRLDPAGTALLAVAEAQHAGLEQALARVDEARRGWLDALDAPARDRLVAELTTLHARLAEHLEHEERHLLPLVAAHLTEAEWHAVGEAGAKSVPASRMLLVLGMFAYEGDPEVLALMLGAAPAPARVLATRLGPRAYARWARRVHGTPRP